MKNSVLVLLLLVFALSLGSIDAATILTWRGQALSIKICHTDTYQISLVVLGFITPNAIS